MANRPGYNSSIYGIYDRICKLQINPKCYIMKIAPIF